MNDCALNVIEYVLLDATSISNAVTFGQAYVKSVGGQASGADCAGSERGQDKFVSSFRFLFVLNFGPFDASRHASFATVKPA